MPLTIDQLRLYLDPAEIHEQTGYPFRWSQPDGDEPAVKDLVRELMGHRCERCGHPYRKGAHGNGQWSPCDEGCVHRGPVRWPVLDGTVVATWTTPGDLDGKYDRTFQKGQEAEWRILTVHHLNGVKHDCRWWNLAALCQVCHLVIQGRVTMQQVYPHPHSEWFKPHAAGFYAWEYLGENLSRDETMGRLDELLALELGDGYRD